MAGLSWVDERRFRKEKREEAETIKPDLLGHCSDVFKVAPPILILDLSLAALVAPFYGSR
jgi:hypothetical protein